MVALRLSMRNRRDQVPHKRVSNSLGSKIEDRWGRHAGPTRPVYHHTGCRNVETLNHIANDGHTNLPFVNIRGNVVNPTPNVRNLNV